MPPFPHGGTVHGGTVHDRTVHDRTVHDGASGRPPRRPGPILIERFRRTPTGGIAAAAAVAWVASAAYMVHFGARWHLDLRVYRGAGAALYHHGSPFTAFYTEGHLPFTYTPFALLVLSPLSLGRLGPVEAGWWLASAACFVLALRLLLGASTTLPTRRAWAVAALLCGVSTLALEPVRSNFDYAQINVILMAMVVADLVWVRGRGRGVLTGLAGAIKLTPLVFLLYFAVARRWRPLLVGIGTFVAVTAVSWAILPSDSTRYWFHQVTDARRTGPLGIGSNQSWNGMVHRAPFAAGHLGTAVWVVLSLATLAVGAVLTRWLLEEDRTVEAVMVLALTELLVSPVSWSHHWSWLAAVPVVAASVWSRHRPVGIALVVLLGLGVVAPYTWLTVVPLSYLGMNSLVLGAATVLVLWLVAERRRRRSGAAAEAGTGGVAEVGPRPAVGPAAGEPATEPAR